MDKKNRMATLVCGSVVLGVIGLTVCVGLWLPKSEEIIQGEVEVTDYRLSSKVPARVLEIRVEEGDRVRQGDTLVVLDAPDVDARLRQAEAAYHAAVAQERKAQNGTREEQVRSAYEQWQKARAGLDVAEKTWQRISRLMRRRPPRRLQGHSMRWHGTGRGRRTGRRPRLRWSGPRVP